MRLIKTIGQWMMWIGLVLCCCGCTAAEQPAEAELNGQGTFEAQTEFGTYTGQFEINGIAFKVQIDRSPAQMFELIYNGQQYTIRSGQGETVCAPDVFPPDSVWALLPEVLRMQWAEPDVWTKSGERLYREFPGGIRIETDGEKNVVLYFSAGNGQAVLHYQGIV